MMKVTSVEYKNGYQSVLQEEYFSVCPNVGRKFFRKPNIQPADSIKCAWGSAPVLDSRVIWKFYVHIIRRF